MTYQPYHWTRCGNAWRLDLIAHGSRRMIKVLFFKKRIHGIKTLQLLGIELNDDDRQLSANY